MFLLFCKFLATLFSQEFLLDHVEQLTFPEMGFEKAGEAYFSPNSHTVIFQAVPKGDPKGATGYQIYTLNLDSKELNHISRGFNSCTCSYFRSDGEKIIFAASPVNISESRGQYRWDLTPYMNIYEANPDGTEATSLTQGDAYHAECSYSPDGSQIVYASNEDGHMNIYVMQSDGSDVKQLTHTTDCYNGGPFFSPDGTKSIFRADRDSPHLLQIYMMDCDGSNLKQLTHNEAVNWAPFWHPSQDVIAYTTSLHGHHNYEIYLLSISTKKEERVTHHQGFDGLPTFNADGTKMLWTSKRSTDNSCQIFIL